MTFNQWFKKQFGALPLSPKQADALRESLYNLRDQAHQIEHRLDADRIIREQYKAAGYADSRARMPAPSPARKQAEGR